MLKIPKTQLSDSPALVATYYLLIPLGALFLFSYVYAPFRSFLILILIYSVILLFYKHVRLTHQIAEIDLQKEEYFEKANLLQAEADKEWGVIGSLQKKIVDYSQLKDLTEQLGMVLTVQEASKTLSSQVNNFYGQKDVTVILYLFHSKTGDLGISASKKGQMEVNLKAKRGDIYDRWVVKTMKPLYIEDTKKDFRFDMDKISREEIRPVRSLINVPLAIGDKAIGILRVDSTRENFFTTDDFRLMTAIGDLGAIAIENAQLYEHIEDLAIRDGLTGLYLRRHLMDQLSQEISRAMRRKVPLTFMMIDLDLFKSYNDNFGHTAGDILLRTLGTILIDMFQYPGNIVCRYGGEEFGVLMPECPKDKALKFAETLRKRIEEEVFVLRRKKTNITISVGVATFPEDAKIKEDLVQAADMALYDAKKKGRNCVCGAKKTK